MKRSLFLTLIILLACVVSVPGKQQGKPADQAGAQKGKPPDQQSPAAKEQVRPTKEGDVVRISVTLVQVDAVVTDKQGKVVTDLESSDFEIYEDGHKQPVTNFSYVAIQPESAPPPTKPEPRSRPALPPVPPARLRPDQVRRTIALVVDDLGLSFESTGAVRDALKKFVDQQMQPGDLVAIIRTGAGMGALQQFTADKRQLYAAIERVRWNLTGRSGIGAFAQIGGEAPTERRSVDGGEAEKSAVENVDELRTEIYAVGTLGALNFVVRGLRELPGPSMRILRSGLYLDFAYFIYNAQLGPATKQPQLESQVSLLREGKQIFAGKVAPLNAGKQTDLKHIHASGRLRLGEDLAPGEYVLQVIVTDGWRRKSTARPASGWISR